MMNVIYRPPDESMRLVSVSVVLNAERPAAGGLSPIDETGMLGCFTARIGAADFDQRLRRMQEEPCSSRRCPHDSDSWMLAPEFCYTLPQTTRQCSGPAPSEDDADAVPRDRSARSRGKAAQRAQTASASTFQTRLQGDRRPAWNGAPPRQRSASCRPQRLLTASADSVNGIDTDSNDEQLQEEQGEGDQENYAQEESEKQPQQWRPYRWEFVTEVDASRDAARTAAAKSYGIGSRNGRALALLGVTAAAAAAAASGDDELDLTDENTRTALHAAQAGIRCTRVVFL
ncbi:hypothetical protein VOLCADRAFT_90291 [Volvox carteri f. nagariensis]|uniref:Uncharacterized protein n=1 Tax=Volvox carteri f. nagariensis TaxID=3068 RepID=D8TTZ6_VOLCA|nr:uncharacterized protein VOLCADRAFT_90291 [Volvox carteri f. nagariensis]EFJ49053.1 hypothetical protein VOLCADRAFT_90291 [Volvox carteri f. nagariensis]|eukprot:XP_002949950.1 hypothetical protein VOLCADRAFT_90291 [Volvox carteri f. nagariensis]